jgi:hypothetical protein
MLPLSLIKHHAMKTLVGTKVQHALSTVENEGQWCLSRPSLLTPGNRWVGPSNGLEDAVEKRNLSLVEIKSKNREMKKDKQ